MARSKKKKKRWGWGRKKNKKKQRGSGRTLFNRTPSSTFPGLAGNMSKRLGGGMRLKKRKRPKKKARARFPKVMSSAMGNNGKGIQKYLRRRVPQPDFPLAEKEMKPALLEWSQ